MPHQGFRDEIRRIYGEFAKSAIQSIWFPCRATELGSQLLITTSSFLAEYGGGLVSSYRGRREE